MKGGLLNVDLQKQIILC